MLFRQGPYSFADQAVCHISSSLLLTFVHQFDLAVYGRNHLVQVAHASSGLLLSADQHSSLRNTNQAFECRNGQTRRNTAFGVDVFALTRFHRNLLHQYTKYFRYIYPFMLILVEFRFLGSDLLPDGYALRVVCKDLTLDTVFKRSDDRSAVGVIFRVGGKYKLDVHWQTQLESTDLDVALLQHVKQ